LRDPRPRTRVASACIDIRAYIRLRLRPPPRALALRRVRHPLLSATNLAARDSPLSPICRSLLDKGMIQQLNTKTTCRDPRILPPSLSLFVSLLFFFFFFICAIFALQSSRRAGKQSTTTMYPISVSVSLRTAFEFSIRVHLAGVFARGYRDSRARFEESNTVHRFGSLRQAAGAKYRVRFRKKYSPSPSVLLSRVFYSNS
jgi:hypothetical protein